MADSVSESIVGIGCRDPGSLEAEFAELLPAADSASEPVVGTGCNGTCSIEEESAEVLPATGSFCVAILYALSSVSSIFSYFNFKLLFFFFDCYIYSI